MQWARVPAKCAVANYHRCGLAGGEADNTTACEFSVITAQCAVIDGKRRRIGPADKVSDPAAVISSGVAADRAILDSQRCAANGSRIVNAATTQVCRVSRNRAVDHG